MKLLSTSAKARWMICGAIAIASLASTTQADVLVSNIGELRRDASTIQENPTELVSLPWAAQSFATDSNIHILDSIDTFFGTLTGDPTIVAELRADTDGTVPGALIRTLSLSGSSITSGLPALITLAPTATTNLTVNTVYWLVLGALGEGSYTWEYAEGNNQSGPGSLGNFAYSDDQGATWANFGSDNPFKVAVNVSPVPVPAMTVLFGVGVGGLLSRRRRGQEARVRPMKKTHVLG